MEGPVLRSACSPCWPWPAAPARPCRRARLRDELIDKISRRLESKHVTDYQLKAVPVEEKHPGKEVGRCEGARRR